MTTQIDGQSAAENLIAQGLFADAGLAAIAAGRLHVGDDGSYAALTIDAKPPKEARAPGSVLIGTASWLLGLLAAGLFIVSFAGQYQYVFAARQQKIASVIEAGMLDVGMVIFSLLALGLSRAGKPSRAERILVMVCSFASAGMNYLAADDASPRSVIAYTAAPVFLAIVVNRVVSVVRRHIVGDKEASPWRPLGAAVLAVAHLAGRVLLYLLRLALDMKATAKGLRQMVLDAAPLPSKTRAPAKVPVVWQARPDGSKKAALITLYQQDRRHGDRSQAARAASDLAPRAGLQAGTARTYINDYLASLNGQAS